MTPQEEAYDYQVSVFTGSAWNAGTDDDVSIAVVGTEGTVRGDDLYSRGNQFEANSVDTFVLRSKKNLGKIQRLEIYKDGIFKGNDWFLDKVVVTFLKDQTTQVFLANCYVQKYNELILDKPQPDGTCFRVTVCTSSESGAGTDANVSINLRGSGESGFQKLDNGRNNFEMGDTDSFELYFENSIGELRTIESRWRVPESGIL